VDTEIKFSFVERNSENTLPGGVETVNPSRPLILLGFLEAIPVDLPVRIRQEPVNFL